MCGQCNARPTVTFPTTRRHRPLAGTKLYCLVTEAHVCWQLAQGWPGFKWSVDCKSSTLLMLPSHTKNCIGVIQMTIINRNWLFIVDESLVDNLTDTRVQALQFFELGRDVGICRLSREDARESRQQTVDHADHAGVGTVHARRDAALQRLETRQYHLLPLCNIHTMSPPSCVQYSHNITSFLCAIFTQCHLLPLCNIHTMSPSFVQYAHNVTSFLCAIVTPCHLPLSFLCAICTQCHLLPLCNSHTISPPSSVQYAHNVTSFLCAIVTQCHLLPLCNIHILVLVDSFNTHTLFGINCCNYPPNLMEIFVTIFKVVAKNFGLLFVDMVSLSLSPF